MKANTSKAGGSKKLFALIVAAAVVGLAALYMNTILANSLPSSKAAVAMGNLTELGSATSTNGSGTSDTGFVTVMQTFIKTPNGKDLHADVALQCGIVTDTTVKSKGGGKDSSSSEGKISVRVRATSEDTGEVRYFDPNENADPETGVTYCSRVQQLEAKFSGLNCTADEEGIITCEDPEELRLLLETFNANAFNFLLADLTADVWKIEVQARAEADVQLGGTELGDSEAEAFVGLGSTVIETLRLVKDADTGPIVELE